MFIPCAIGYGQLLIIILVIILLFGAKRIPELMRGLGRGVKEFKDAVNRDYTADERNRNNRDNSRRDSNNSDRTSRNDPSDPYRENR